MELGKLRKEITQILPTFWYDDNGKSTSNREGVDKILALTDAYYKEAGYKPGGVVACLVMEGEAKGWNDCEKWFESNDYVRLAEDQIPPLPERKGLSCWQNIANKAYKEASWRRVIKG